MIEYIILTLALMSAGLYMMSDEYECRSKLRKNYEKPK